MAFFCRISRFDLSGNVYGYNYSDTNYLAYSRGMSNPSTFSEAETVCNLVYSSPPQVYSTIDGLMTYSSGSPFDFTQIDPAVMSEAVAAGFMLSYGLIALAWGGRQIVKSIWPL